MIQANHDVELRVNIVLKEAESSVFPPVHHFIEKLDIVLYRTQGERNFLTHAVSNLAQHTADVDAEHF